MTKMANVSGLTCSIGEPARGATACQRAIAIALCALLAGCSSTSESGGLLGLVSPTSATQEQAAAAGALPTEAPAQDPLARPIHVAQTAARAQRCGFVFEPEKLKTAYLAHAASSGVTPEDLKKYELTYRFTLTKVSKAISQTENYCSDNVLQEIREDLPPYVAGDFTKPIRVAEKKKEPQRGLFGSILKPRGAAQEFDRKKIFTPSDQKL